MKAQSMRKVRRVLIPAGLVGQTLEKLRTFGRNGCEGFLLWLGNIDDEEAHVTEGIVPPQNSVKNEEGVGYFVSGQTLFEVARYLASRKLRLIAQVHSHPGRAYHSEADDRYAVATAEGSFSLVVPDFGLSSEDMSDWAIYQLNRSGWHALKRDTIEETFIVCEDGNASQ